MSTARKLKPICATALALACALALSACAFRRAPKPVDWAAGKVISYRLVAKEDFVAKTSNSVWGNFAHGAEICTTILPREDHEETGAFHAVMRRECSFWNKAIGPLGWFLRLLGLGLGIPVIYPVKQPDWYVLQHEQIHFAINEVAALRLSKELAKVPPTKRRPSVIRLGYELTLAQAADRHRQFDLETSGTFRPDELEKWVRVLEFQMGELCGSEVHCQVRLAAQ